jgi:uncharacterized membrane protein YhaH (DUF805 family)
VSSAEALARAIVRAWTFVYTIGAASPIREGRRDEIASDLWEHARAGAEESARPRTIAGQMLARCFLGLGADVSWRVQVGLGQRRAVEKEVQMSDQVKRNWWIPGAVALIGAGIVFGFLSRSNGIEEGRDPSLLGDSVQVAVAGLLIVVLPILALLVRRSHPGWTFWMFVPAIVVSLSPLLWLGDAVRDEGVFMLLIPAAGIVTLIGALTNLAQASVSNDAKRSAAA